MISANKNSSPRDRRAESRFAIHCPVECFNYSSMKESNVLNAIVEDLSSEGLCLKLNCNLLVGTNLCIRCDGLSSCAGRFELPSNLVPVLTISEVKWCRSGNGTDSEYYFAGVRHVKGDYD